MKKIITSLSFGLVVYVAGFHSGTIAGESIVKGLVPPKEPLLHVKMKGDLDYTPPYQADFDTVHESSYSVKVIDGLRQQDELKELCPNGFVLDHDRTRYSARAELLCYTSFKKSPIRVGVVLGIQESFANHVVVSDGEFFWQPRAEQFAEIQKAKGDKVVVAIKDSSPDELDFEARYSKSEFETILNKGLAKLIYTLMRELRTIDYDTQRQANNVSSWGLSREKN